MKSDPVQGLNTVGPAAFFLREQFASVRLPCNLDQIVFDYQNNIFQKAKTVNQSVNKTSENHLYTSNLELNISSLVCNNPLPIIYSRLPI